MLKFDDWESLDKWFDEEVEYRKNLPHVHTIERDDGLYDFVDEDGKVLLTCGYATQVKLTTARPPLLDG